MHGAFLLFRRITPFIICLPSAALAQTIHQAKEKPWSVTVGAGVVYGSLYRGSAKQTVFPFPVLVVNYYHWSLDLDGLRYSALNTEPFRAGVGIGYDFGRKDDDDTLPSHARGVGDVDGGATAILFAEYYLLEWLGLTAEITKSSGDADSLLFTAGARSDFPIHGESLFGSIGISTTWANNDHMEVYYGVNAAQAARTGLRRYDAKSGIESVSFEAGVTYMITDRWAYGISGGLDFLQGSAKDSPIIGDRLQPNIMTSISYTF